MRDPYFDLPGVSNSDLKHFKRSPEHYKEYKRSGSIETDAMTFGSAFHCYVLENKLFDQNYTILDESLKPAPGKDYRTLVNREWKEAFYNEAIATGKTVIDPGQFETIKRMTDKLYSNNPSKDLLEFTRNEFEKSLKWNWKKTGCKGKCDISNEVFLADLKTTQNADPSEFHRQIIKMEYYRQAGMYLDGDAGGHINYGAVKDFYFIAIESTAPYGISVSVCSKDLIQKGIEEYRGLVEQIQACWDNEEWQDYSFKSLSRMDGIFEVDLPHYMKD